MSNHYSWPFGPIPMGPEAQPKKARHEHGPGPGIFGLWVARARSRAVPGPEVQPAGCVQAWPEKAGPIGPAGGTQPRHGPRPAPQARPAKEPLEACCQPSPAERVCKGRRPQFARPRPPFARPARPRSLSASPLPSRPRLTLTLDRASPLPSRLRLDLTVFSNSDRRLAAVGRPLYPLLFVFLPTFASSPVDSLPQLKSVPKPGLPSINLVDPAVLDLAGVLGAPDLVSP